MYAADAFRTSDHDIVCVDIALGTDGDGLEEAPGIVLGTNPLAVDPDDDGLGDGAEDANRNGVIDYAEMNPASADSDGDGVQDATERGVTRGLADSDGSGALPGTERRVFSPDADPTTTSLPLNADTGDVGRLDGQEDLNGNGAVDAGETEPNSGSAGPGRHQLATLKAFLGGCCEARCAGRSRDYGQVTQHSSSRSRAAEGKDNVDQAPRG